MLDGEVVIARDGALDFEALLLRIHPAASRVRMLRRGLAGELRRLGPARARRRGPARRCRRASDGRGSRRVLGGAEPPVHLTPATRDRATAADWFERFEGAGLDGVIAKRLDGHVPAGQAGDAQDQAPAHRRLRRRRVPLAQERARDARRLAAARPVRRRRARSTTSGSPRRSRGTGARRWSRSWRRSARTRSTATPGRAGPSGPPSRRRAASASRARRRAGTAARTCRGSRSARSASPRSPTTISRGPLPPRHDVQALAPRQAARGLPLRPARGDRAVRARPDLRRRRLTIRLGLVGAGWIARLHLEALERLGRTELVGVVSGRPWPARPCWPERWGGRRVRRPRPRWSTAVRPDVAYVCVPPCQAVAIGERLVELGIPFLTEKPLAAGDAAGPVRLGDRHRSGRAGRRGRLPPPGPGHPARDPRPAADRAAAADRRALAGRDAATGLVVAGRPRAAGRSIEQATHLYDLARLLARRGRGRRRGIRTVLGPAWASAPGARRRRGRPRRSFASRRGADRLVRQRPSACGRRRSRSTFASDGLLTRLRKEPARPGRLARVLRRRQRRAQPAKRAAIRTRLQAAAFLDAVEAGDPAVVAVGVRRRAQDRPADARGGRGDGRPG